MNRITVLVAEGYALFREGLVALLAQEEDLEVVGEATDGLQVMSQVETLQPDILLLDLQMPTVDCDEALTKIRQRSPGTKVLILSGLADHGLTDKALELGAKGYLSKELTRKDMVKAIRAVHAGEIWVGHKVLARLLEGLSRRVYEAHAQSSLMQGSLTDREREIVGWVIQGMTNKEIATRLGISDRTVKAHLRNIFSKLKISRRLQLVLHRIVEQPD